MEAFLTRLRGHQVLARDLFLGGGTEANYDDVPQPLGSSAFAPTHEARGVMFSTPQCLGVAGEAAAPPPVAESDLNDGRSRSAADERRSEAREDFAAA